MNTGHRRAGPGLDSVITISAGNTIAAASL
jgi:hypothetical protein